MARVSKAYYPLEQVDTGIGDGVQLLPRAEDSKKRTERTCTKSISHKFWPLNAIATEKEQREQQDGGGKRGGYRKRVGGSGHPLVNRTLFRCGSVYRELPWKLNPELWLFCDSCRVVREAQIN